jgi:hypothetical protein
VPIIKTNNSSSDLVEVPYIIFRAFAYVKSTKDSGLKEIIELKVETLAIKLCSRFSTLKLRVLIAILSIFFTDLLDLYIDQKSLLTSSKRFASCED